MRSCPRWCWLPLAVLCPGLVAQSYDDLVLVRNRPMPYSSVLQLRAGMVGAIPVEEDPATGLTEDYGGDGSVYYRNDRFGSRESMLEAYAGRDGAYVGLRDRQLVGNETGSRLEVTARYFPFYREGFYRGSSFVPTGRYEGRDFGAYLGFSRPAAEELTIEGGPYYRRYTFSKTDDTAPNYVIPDDFNVLGARMTVEHNTLTLDRRTGKPREGFVLTATLEADRNDSNKTFGVIGGWESSLPSGLWRVIGHLEWLFPSSDSAVWELVADGWLADEDDRVRNYDAQQPQGNLWVDGKLRFRWDASDYFSITPYFNAQYIRILQENGAGSDNEFFMGGGADLWLHLSEALSLYGWYSFLNNESRPPVSISEDHYGEHMFFVGMVIRIGGVRQ